MQSGLGKNFAASSKEQTRSVEAAEGTSKIVCILSPTLLLFSGQQLNVQMAIGDKCCPLGVHIGTSAV